MWDNGACLVITPGRIQRYAPAQEPYAVRINSDKKKKYFDLSRLFLAGQGKEETH